METRARWSQQYGRTNHSKGQEDGRLRSPSSGAQGPDLAEDAREGGWVGDGRPAGRYRDPAAMAREKAVGSIGLEASSVRLA